MCRPSADLLAERTDDKYAYYSFCRVSDGFVARFYGTADFWICSSLQAIVCRPAPGTSDEFLSMLMTGAVNAFLHACAGRMALHASAVSLTRGAIAFVGPSGAGKSTLAAQMLAGGATLVTDDVLVIDRLAQDDAVWARPGAIELRLHHEPRSVGVLENRRNRRVTADGRVAIAVPTAPTPLVAISLLARLARERTAAKPRARRMGAAEATHVLAGSQRIEGWHDVSALKQQFAMASEIAARLPVIELAVPLEPSYTRDAAETISAECARVSDRSEEMGL